MIKSEVKRNVVVTLTLEFKEALWLKGMVQNPLKEDESLEDSEMRRTFWEALKEIDF